MGLTATAAKGVVSVVVEATSGEQSLLVPTAISSTMTGISNPTGSTGCKIHLILKYWTASGTLTILGTGTPNNTETITVAAPTAQQLQSAQAFDYVSTNNYTTITNITTTGCTNGMLEVRGDSAGKFNIPVTKFSAKLKKPKYSPKEYTGLMAADVRLIDTLAEVPIDAFDSDFYGDLSLYWVYAMLGSPSWATLPASPLSIVAAATIVASMTLANQPTAPRMRLIYTVTGITGSPSVTITGTSYGKTVTETFAPTANGTYYSANLYSALTSIGGTTNGTTLAVTGVFGWLGTVNGEATRQTLCEEFFDGVGSWIYPYSYFTDGEMTISTKDVAKLTLKGEAHSKLAIGDRTTTPLSGTNRTTPLGVPLSDLPIGGWQTQIYLDDIFGTAGTTVNLDLEGDIKIALKCPVDKHYTWNNTQAFTRLKEGKRECMVDVSKDVIDIIQHEYYRQNFSQYLVAKLIGEYIGTTGGVQYSKGWIWTLPVQYDGEYGDEADPVKGAVTAKPKLRTRYDAGLGTSYQLQICTTTPPNYNS